MKCIYYSSTCYSDSKAEDFELFDNNMESDWIIINILDLNHRLRGGSDVTLNLLDIFTLASVSAMASFSAKTVFFYVFHLSFFFFFIAGNEAKGFWIPAQHVNLSAISEQFPSGAIQNV